jgi:hypothetical protein
VESIGILREDKESTISEAEKVHISYNAKHTYWRAIYQSLLSKYISIASVTLLEIITKV